jgi:SAM-dependent methyltransferase
MGASTATSRTESEHARRVHGFFAEPDRYLGNDARLGIRRLVCRQLAARTDRTSILDIGCGDGTMSLPLVGPQSRLTLLDFSAPMLERAAANVAPEMRPRVEIVCRDLAGFAGEHRYTLVLCLGVLAHVPDVSHALAKVATLIEPGGHCLIQITDASRWLGRMSHAWYSRRHSRRADGYVLNRLDGPSLVAEAGAQGLRLVEQRNYSLSVPGIRRLPVGVQFALERGFYSSWFAEHGGESMFLFVRDPA